MNIKQIFLGVFLFLWASLACAASGGENLSLVNAKAQVLNQQIALTEARQALSFAKSKLQQMSNNPVYSESDLKTRESWQHLVSQNRREIAHLTTTLIQARQQLQTVKARNRELQLSIQLRRVSSQTKVIAGQQQQLAQAREKMTRQLAAMPSSSSQYYFLSEKVALNQINALLLGYRSETLPSALQTVQHPSLNSLHERGVKSQSVLEALESTKQLVRKKVRLLQQRKSLMPARSKESSELAALVAQYRGTLNNIHVIENQVAHNKQSLQQLLRKQYSYRQTLPGLDGAAWFNLVKQTLQVPIVLGHALRDLCMQVAYQIQTATTLRLYLFILFFVLFFNAWFFLRQSFRRMLDMLEEKSRRFSRQVLAVLIVLVKRNLGTLFVITGLFFSSRLFGLNFEPWFSIAIIFLISRIALILARLLLFESDHDVAGKDVRLYRGLRWVFAFTAMLMVLTIIAHTLPVAPAVKTLFNKLFMLILLVLSFLLFRAWSVLPHIMQRAFSVRRLYVKRVISFLAWVIPFTVFSNAMIGLIGYVDLAWTMGKYQAVTLLVLMLYMVMRGLLIDFMELNYDLVIRHFKEGWVLSRAFVRPFDRVLRSLLFMGMIYLLLHIYGLEHNQRFVDGILAFLNKTLFTFGSNNITPKLLCKITVFGLVLYWLSKWSREFAYRWLYKNAKDIGVRNSFSVFTQYAIVIFGIVFGLKLFGVDLKGFAVVAAAFAAGLGFGLRDMISNFISGIFLLIERPFRAGDTISIGKYEGEVLSTGMRSMKIRTWDHVEVIIPNAEIFTQSFMNWTHQDSIVRTVVKVNVDRQDDPELVQRLILKVLEESEAVVESPEPQVFMKDISDALIEFEVRYYINLSETPSRPRIRSSVLFSIWNALKENGIHPPVQQVLLRGSNDHLRSSETT